MPNDAAMYSFPVTAYSSFPLLRVLTESFISPVAFYDVQLDTLDMALKWMAPVAGAYEHWMYKSERVLVSADDGLQVPLSIMYK
jgi:oligopeptidase B